MKCAKWEQNWLLQKNASASLDIRWIERLTFSATPANNVVRCGANLRAGIYVDGRSANIPVQVGVPSAKKRVSFAPPRTESGSPNDAQPGPSAVLNISALADTRSSSFIERDLFSPPITSEDYSNPPAPSSSVSTRTNSDIDETESHTLVPLRPRKRQKTESRSPSAISALFASDLSELTDSEEEEEQTVAIRSIKVEEPPVRRQSRRISDTTRERALVLFRKPVQALVQSKPRYKRKRRSGLMHRKKGVSKKTTINASQGVHTDYGMVRRELLKQPDGLLVIIRSFVTGTHP